MDIRTKFVFALIAVAFASMATLGATVYRSVENELSQRTLDRLDGLAEFKDDALEGILAGWHDRVALVASRTRLRESLAGYEETGDDDEVIEITRILEDALGAAPLFRQLWVHDAEGRPVAHVGPGPETPLIGTDVRDHGDAPEYVGVSFAGTGAPTVNFSAPLLLDGRNLGSLHAILSTEELEVLSSNHEGLGSTGETMVVVRDSAGTPRVLHPVRFAPTGPFEDEFGIEEPDGADRPAGAPRGAGLSLASDGAALMALTGESARRPGGLTDYRGEDVWAATRYLSETGWGVVVKVDTDQQLQPIHDFRERIARLVLTLTAFTIVIGTLLGFRFSRPILELADAARRIHAGDLHARADIQREDEVGLLARTFDEMAESLEEKVGLLTEFRRFFDVSIDMMCIASLEGYFMRINSAFVRELGWSEEELLSRPFVSFVHADDVAATQREMEKLSEGEPTISFENRFLCMDGTYKTLYWNSYPEEDTGRIYAIARVTNPNPPLKL